MCGARSRQGGSVCICSGRLTFSSSCSSSSSCAGQEHERVRRRACFQRPGLAGCVRVVPSSSQPHAPQRIMQPCSAALLSSSLSTQPCSAAGLGAPPPSPSCASAWPLPSSAWPPAESAPRPPPEGAGAEGQLAGDQARRGHNVSCMPRGQLSQAWKHGKGRIQAPTWLCMRQCVPMVCTICWWRHRGGRCLWLQAFHPISPPLSAAPSPPPACLPSPPWRRPCLRTRCQTAGTACARWRGRPAGREGSVGGQAVWAGGERWTDAVPPSRSLPSQPTMQQDTASGGARALALVSMVPSAAMAAGAGWAMWGSSGGGLVSADRGGRRRGEERRRRRGPAKALTTLDRPIMALMRVSALRLQARLPLLPVILGWPNGNPPHHPPHPPELLSG